jgi:hypothetical protein
MGASLFGAVGPSENLMLFHSFWQSYPRHHLDTGISLFQISKTSCSVLSSISIGFGVVFMGLLFLLWVSIPEYGNKEGWIY